MSDRYVLSYKCVGFINSTLNQLPMDLFSRYPNMEYLYAANLGLRSLSRTMFETAYKLVDIHLEGNNLTGELWACEPKMIFLTLNENYLTVKIVTFYLFLSIELENFLFFGALNLRRIVLSDNQISRISKDTFRKMIVKQANGFDSSFNTYQQKLEEIDLSYNHLSDLDYETFSQLSTLKFLYFRGNSIKLKYGMFPLNLKKLDLSYNQLGDFSLKQLVNSQLLEELILSGNKFTNVIDVERAFPEAIFQLMHIHKLELSDCFACSTLADLLAHFKRTNRNVIVHYESEKLNGSNIFGISCDETVEKRRWWDLSGERVATLHSGKSTSTCEHEWQIYAHSTCVTLGIWSRVNIKFT